MLLSINNKHICLHPVLLWLLCSQARAPFYAMTDEQRAQWVQRVTMIQCLPLGKYCAGEEKKKDKDLRVELSEEFQGTEKKGDVDRE